MTCEMVDKIFRVFDAKFEEINVLAPRAQWTFEMFKDNQLAFSKNLIKGTSCSNKKAW
ncbi:hypothetical protein L0F63_006897, partial [Massospora cicadina]